MHKQCIKPIKDMWHCSDKDTEVGRESPGLQSLLLDYLCPFHTLDKVENEPQKMQGYYLKRDKSKLNPNKPASALET